MRKGIAVLLCLALLGSLGNAQAKDDKKARWDAVRQYLLKKDDYPELFGDKPYRMKIDNVIVEDVDNDGQDEVVLHVTPHYLQSPTIILFKVSKDLKVTRVREGLAPGPLVPLVSDFLDSHTVGEGVDVTLGEAQGDLEKRKKFVQGVLSEKKGAVVEYANFLHIDNRKGKGTYVDMTALASPPSEQTCEKFQFSMPEEIAVLPKKDGSGNYLLARVGKQIYQYKIHKIRDDGFLEKTLVVRPAP